MADTLSNLHGGRPGEVLELLAAVRALLISHHKLAIERLLEDGARRDFLLDGQSNFQSHTMRFRPDPGRVGDSYSLETSHSFQAYGHEFSGLRFTGDIRRRAAAVPLTPPTFKELPIRADAFRYIGSGL